MSRVLLYFGSFNPVHNGHTAIAEWAARQRIADEVWMVVSPQNPLRDDLAPDEDRLAMTRLAIEEQLSELPVMVSDVEFGLPRPSYTIDTLRFLGCEHPGNEFAVLAGADILEQLPRWKEYERLRADYRFYIYPRDGYTFPDGVSDGVAVSILEGAPRWDFSSTDVRQALSEGGDISGMVTHAVEDYIYTHALWRPATAEGWIRRGKWFNSTGRMGEALTAFLRALELDPANVEAIERIKMLREIFAFHYVDYYNP